MPTLPNCGQRRSESAVRKQTISNHLQIPESNRQKISGIKRKRDVLGTHQEAILDGMPVDFGRKLAATLRGDSPHMPCNCLRGIHAPPPRYLGPPGQVRVLAVGKELLVEKFSVHRNIVDHAPTVKGSCPGCAKDVLHLFKLPMVRLTGPAIKMTQVGQEINPS